MSRSYKEGKKFKRQNQKQFIKRKEKEDELDEIIKDEIEEFGGMDVIDS